MNAQLSIVPAPLLDDYHFVVPVRAYKYTPYSVGPAQCSGHQGSFGVGA